MKTDFWIKMLYEDHETFFISAPARTVENVGKKTDFKNTLARR
jgi:hypothetical protein